MNAVFHQEFEVVMTHQNGPRLCRMFSEDQQFSTKTCCAFRKLIKMINPTLTHVRFFLVAFSVHNFSYTSPQVWGTNQVMPDNRSAWMLPTPRPNDVTWGIYSEVQTTIKIGTKPTEIARKNAVLLILSFFIWSLFILVEWRRCMGNMEVSSQE